MYILANGKLITRDAALPYLPDGGVAIEGEKIAAAGATAELKARYPQAEFLDAKGGVIMPGLINAHTHTYSALARGLTIRGSDPQNFFEVLSTKWWVIDSRLDLAGTRAGADALYLDCIRQGVTTVFDHHASYGEVPGSLFAVAESGKRFGIRTCLCYEVSDRNGEEKALEAIAENRDFLEHCRRERDPMLAAMFGGHALFTISDRTFDRMAEANSGRTGFHIHVAEGMNDVYDSIRNYGRRPVQRLLDHDILGPKTLLGHCIHINTAEMDIIRETGTMCVNNPQSNMGNGVGCAPVLQLLARGVTVGLGTDAYTNDMLESAKAALGIQRHNAGLPNIAWGEVTGMLFKNNPAIAEKYFDVPLGRLAPGAAADVIVMDYKPFTPFSEENADGHILFGMTGRQCQTTICNGRVLMKDRELAGVDEEAENARILEETKKLWGVLNNCQY